MALIYEDKVKLNRGAFVAKVRSVADKLGVDPNWLMAVMNFESRLDSTAVNPFSGATGLIQFMPATAAELGTSTSKLARMSNVDQLDYVYRYYKRYSHKITRYVDLYLATLFPRALGKSDDYILQTDTLAASKIAQQNPVFDLNKDQAVTVGEVKEEKEKRIPPNWRHLFLEKKDSVAKFTRRNWVPITAVTVMTILFVVGMLAYRKEAVRFLNTIRP